MTTKKIVLLSAAGVAVLLVANHMYKKSKAPIGLSGPLPGSPAHNAAGKAGGKYVRGGYDAGNNRTWIFPAGNRGGGTWVSGYVNVPQGTYFNYNP